MSPDWNQLRGQISLNFHGASFNPNAPNPNSPDADKAKKTFYIRTAYRHEPDMSTGMPNTALPDALSDPKRPMTLAAPETRVSDNYLRLVLQTINSVFDPANDDETKGAIRERLIGKIRQSMLRMFDGLNITGIGRPLERNSFQFNK